jgi:hypothetical protein
MSWVTGNVDPIQSARDAELQPPLTSAKNLTRGGQHRAPSPYFRFIDEMMDELHDPAPAHPLFISLARVVPHLAHITYVDQQANLFFSLRKFH